MINRLNNKLLLISLTWVLGCSTTAVANSTAQTYESELCTQFKIDESDDEFLTAQEKVQQMEQAFVDSIDREEACIVKTPGNGGGGQNGHGEGLEGEGAEGEGAEGEGTEGEENEDQSQQQLANKREDKTLSGGSAPKDIPPAENDSVLEAQIRKAAESETDPVKRKKLWNEYRRYKGIEIKQ